MLTLNESNIAAAIGRLPSGCAILTVADDNRSTGVLVSWVQQASFDPPAISVCIKKARPAGVLVDACNKFVINVIGEDPTPMFKHFGQGFSLEDDAFAGVETQACDYGPLLSGCIAQLGCCVRSKVDAGDHDLYVAVVEAGAGTADLKPYVHLRKNGLSY